jgi:AcrR family transcriptional regulator
MAGHAAAAEGTVTAVTTVADGVASPVDIESEFDRFAADMMQLAARQADGPGRRVPSDGKRRGPQPSISAETIYEHTLVLLDAEGARAVTVRRLAADLKISTRTLYKRIGNRDNLIRNVVELHFAKLNLNFRECGSWESTASNWCLGLHGTLCAHPHLTDLMTDDDVLVLGDYVHALAKATVQEGVSRDTAAECCLALANVTINDAIRQVRARRHANGAPQVDVRTPGSSRSFSESVRLILAGVRAEASDRHRVQ